MLCTDSRTGGAHGAHRFKHFNEYGAVSLCIHDGDCHGGIGKFYDTHIAPCQYPGDGSGGLPFLGLFQSRRIINVGRSNRDNVCPAGVLAACALKLSQITLNFLRLILKPTRMKEVEK
jgi:hypothetical protein